MKKNMIQLTAVLGLTACLASCMGQSSNPMEKYGDLKTGLPTSEVSETQSLALDVFTAAKIPTGTEFADLQLQGTGEVNNSNFLEGKEGILYFRLGPKSAKVTKWDMKVVDFPISSRPTLVATKHNNVTGIKWTPPVGTIPPGRNSINLKLNIQTVVAETSDTNLRGIMRSDIVDIFVTRNESIPSISIITKLENGYDEGQTVPFIVEVDDSTSALSPKAPDVRFGNYRYSNTEAFRADGFLYMKPDPNHPAPERVAGSKTRWRFYSLIKADPLELDRNRLGVEDLKSSSVDVCFYVQAYSSLQISTAPVQVCYKGRYAAQAPVIKWENDALKEVKGGGTTVIKFTIASSNGLGQIGLKSPANQISGLTGKKELVCSTPDAANLSVQSCELTWTPLCVKAPLTKKLTLKVDNVTGKKTKSESFVRELVVVPSEENCPTPVKIEAKPAPTKPAAAKPAVQPKEQIKEQPAQQQGAT